MAFKTHFATIFPAAKLIKVYSSKFRNNQYTLRFLDQDSLNFVLQNWQPHFFGTNTSVDQQTTANGTNNSNLCIIIKNIDIIAYLKIQH